MLLLSFEVDGVADGIGLELDEEDVVIVEALEVLIMLVVMDVDVAIGLWDKVV